MQKLNLLKSIFIHKEDLKMLKNNYIQMLMKEMKKVLKILLTKLKF